jgi:MoaA/NifB/PqqE/SkfB family radical SAM enzyme
MTVTNDPQQTSDLRVANRALNNAEYDHGQLTLRSRPLALFVEITENCSLWCDMCRPKQRYDRTLDMSYELFDAVAAELFGAASLVDLRGWGESTMRPDLDRFIQVAASYGPQLRIVTNAQISRPGLWDQLMAHHAIVVASCDAATPELFAELRTGGQLSRFEASIRTLVERRDAHGAPRGNVVFTCVASNRNLHELAAVVDLAARFDVSKVIFFPLQDNHAAGTSPLPLPTTRARAVDTARAAYADAVRRGREEGIVVQLGAAPSEGLALPDMVKQAPCMHPWSYAYINHAGGVGFCDHLIGEPSHIFASLRDLAFEEIWNGPDFVELRRQHLAGDLSERFADCRWCYKQRYVDFEELFHPKYEARRVASDVRVELLGR